MNFRALPTSTKVVLLAMAVILAGRAWLLATDPRAFLGFGGGLTGLRVTVPRSGVLPEPLREGDRIVAFNGDESVVRARTTVFHRTGVSAGERYALTIERDGVRQDVELVAGKWQYDWIMFVVGVSWCAVALLIGLAGSSAQLAFLATAVVGVWFLADSAGGRLPYQFIYPFHAVIGFHFAYRFPSTVPRRALWTGVVLLLYAGATVVVASNLVFDWISLTRSAKAATEWLADNRGWTAMRGTLDTIVYTTAIAGVLVVMFANYRLLDGFDERRRVRWVVVSAFAGLAVNLFFALGAVLRQFVAPELVPWFWRASASIGPLDQRAGVLLTVAIPIGIAIAVLKYRLFDIRVVLRRGVQYLFAKRALQAILAIPVIALVYTVISSRDRTVAEIAMGSTAYLYWIVALGVSVIYRRPLRQWLDRKFFREQYDRDQVLGRLLEDVEEASSIEDLSTIVSEQLNLALHPKSLGLCLDDGRRLVMSHTSLGHPDEHCAEPRGSLLSYLGGRTKPVDLERAPADLPVADAQWLVDLGVHLVVSITGTTQRSQGAILLGEKMSEEPYSASDRRLLQAAARQIAGVRERLQLKTQLAQEQLVRQEVLARVDSDVASLLRECSACGTCFDGAVETCERDGRPLTLMPLERTVDAKYRINRLIGRGGMGSVYEASDLRLARSVAVKILPGRTSDQDVAIRRFEREARAAARLKHPNIVDVYDFGILAGGGAYLVMECLGGTSLRSALQREGRFSVETTAEWLEQILDAVAAAHESGVVHRDLKPENIVGERRGDGRLTVKIVDFGLAKLKTPEENASATVTHTEAVIGTFGYMAPEQIVGPSVDHRCDLFAIGVILAEMLTGKRPFSGETFHQVSHSVLNDEYHLPETFATMRSIDKVLQRCLAKARQDRFDSAAALKRAVVPLLRGDQSESAHA